MSGEQFTAKREKSGMMKGTIFILCVFLFSLLCFVFVSCFSALTEDDLIDDDLDDIVPLTDTTVSSDGGPLVLVHYMPWYEAPPVASYGGHWTGGGHFSPPNQIASHQMPLTGPYDSRDKEVLEYQVKLMKTAGIDGVIFDWYGIHKVNDYGPIHESTLAMIKVLKREGLKFAICYEDQTVPRIVEATGKTSEQIGKETFSWMQKNWFRDSAYVRYQGRPLVLCFGPQHYSSKSQWDAVFSVTKPRPYFADLDLKTTWAETTYDWPPMWASEGPPGNKGELSIPRLQQYLAEFDNKVSNKAYRIATAFPAFDDIYEDQGGQSYGNLVYNNGETFKLTFDAAMEINPHVIQVATWNDYGEGTIIEPTVERGYTVLEYLQDKQKEWNPEFPYDHDDLHNIPVPNRN